MEAIPQISRDANRVFDQELVHQISIHSSEAFANLHLVMSGKTEYKC